MPGTEMTLPQAQEEFATILARLSPSKVPQFFAWIKDGVGSLNGVELEEDQAERQLHLIRKEIKQMVPAEACFKSEKIIWPQNGHDSSCQPDITVHVDDFLYDEDEVEELVTKGKLQKYYCGACGSKEIKSLVFITHSMSSVQLRYIFTYLLPKLGIPLEDKVLVDIGSRLGGVLYAAALFCPNIGDAIGIEMNKEMCDVQTRIVDSHSLWNKINIVCDDFRNQKKVFAKADIVIMNNVFEFFHTEEEQVKCWKKIREFLKPKTVIVHAPSLWKTIEHLKLGFEIEQWVEQLDARKIRNEFVRENHLPKDAIGILEVWRVR
ncbi:hypothetical protein FO519_008578 [Halicephalobus sp. NKZ332]|nr:hypothetical protein FO519_008578 [Halicephalobus sp. NKZ332]